MFLFLGVRNSRAPREYALCYAGRSAFFKGANVLRRSQQLFRETESVTSTAIVNACECTDGSQTVVGAEVPCEIRHTVNLIRRVIQFILPLLINGLLCMNLLFFSFQ
jgi:hypothetical protein